MKTVMIDILKRLEKNPLIKKKLKRKKNDNDDKLMMIIENQVYFRFMRKIER